MGDQGTMKVLQILINFDISQQYASGSQYHIVEYFQRPCFIIQIIKF